jgi:hypothetical protein
VGWVVASVVAVGLATLYLSWTAGRLDRLHARIDAAWAALDAQLVRRAAVAAELAGHPLVRAADPSLADRLAHAAHTAYAAGAGEREAAENALGKALRSVLGGPAAGLVDDPSGRRLLADLDNAVAKVALARGFFNGTVRDTRAMRRHLLVRWFRLAGQAPWPVFFEIDDTLDELAKLTGHGRPVP